MALECAVKPAHLNVHSQFSTWWRWLAATHWQPGAELAAIWGGAGVSTEVGRLRAVLMHRPGDEIGRVTDASAVLWTCPIEQELATYQHDMLADTYRKLGVQVHYMQPGSAATPNLYFARDHFFMTPQGAIMSHMGSAARAGEERIAAGRDGHFGGCGRQSLGARVLWASESRSPETATRATRHGLEDTGSLPALCARCDTGQPLPIVQM
jgi:hypothetical protein